MSHKSKQTIDALALWAALPMARTAQVESRLRMILKPNANRRTLTRRAVAESLLAAALGVGVLSALRPEARAQSNAAASSTSWKQALPNGATVELVGIADVPPSQEGRWRKDDLPPRRGWWQPDGSPLAQAPVDSDKQMTPVGTKNVEAWRQFAVRVSPPPGTAASSVDITFDLSQANGLTDYSWQQANRENHPLPNVWLVGANLSDLQNGPVIRCGMAAGPWETGVVKVEYPESMPFQESHTFGGVYASVLFSRASEIGGGAAITVAYNLPDASMACRVIAVNRTGRVFVTSSDDGSSMDKTRQATWVFKGLPLKSVKEFRFQARPYGWAEFKGIALTPGRR